MSIEVANSEDAEDIIRAAQAAIINAMQEVLRDMRKAGLGNPGLTWEGLDYFFEKFKQKELEIIHQEFEA